MIEREFFDAEMILSSFAENPGLLSPGMNAPAAAAVLCGQWVFCFGGFRQQANGNSGL
jgi:hypothetical protein